MINKGSYFPILVVLMIFLACNEQSGEKSHPVINLGIKDLSTSEDNPDFSRETAHPRAQLLLLEDFYWSPIDEYGPFGNDAGADAFAGFSKWRMTNHQASPITFLRQHLANREYETFNWNEMDTGEIRKYIQKPNLLIFSDNASNDIRKEFEKELEKQGSSFDEEEFENRFSNVRVLHFGDRHLMDQDNSIIAVGFGQFVLEGRIDEDIKSLTRTALERELLPILLDQVFFESREFRKERLNKMLSILEEMNS